MFVLHLQCQYAGLFGILVGIASPVHHPAPAGLDPCHTRQGEFRGCSEILLLSGRDGYFGAVGLVKSDCFSVMEGTNLAVWRHICGV